MAALLFAVMVPLYNLAGVLLLRQGAESRAGRNSAGRTLATNPLIISCLVGILVSLAGFRVPASLLRTLHAAGERAMPLALLAIGAGIDLRLLHRHGVSTLAAARIKVGLPPLIGWFFVCRMGLSSGDRLIPFVCLACPTAVSAYVLCDQMEADADLAVSVIVLSTLLSVIFLTIAVAVSGGWRKADLFSSAV